MNILFATGVLMALLLCGCERGGAGAPASTPLSPLPAGVGHTVKFEGVWQGTITSSNSLQSANVISFVNGWGEISLLTDDVMFAGFTTVVESTLYSELVGITAVGKHWPDGNRTNHFVLNGTIEDDQHIEAQYDGDGDSGIVTMAWSATGRNTQAGEIDGLWAILDNDRNILATVRIDAVSDFKTDVSGSHINGCTYAGMAESWSSFYAFDFSSIVISGCPPEQGVDINGEYAGVGALLDITDDGTDEIVLVVGMIRQVNPHGLASQLVLYLHPLPAS